MKKICGQTCECLDNSQCKFNSPFIAPTENHASRINIPMGKTYRAIRHEITRAKQKAISPELHHPDEKVQQIQNVLKSESDLNILELFSGTGNCTHYYEYRAKTVKAYELNKEKFKLLSAGIFSSKVELINKNSFREYHRLIADGKKFDVIDLDPYGFPTRLFPDIFLLIDNGYLFVTMPKPYVNILNGITATHLISYFGEQNPSSQSIIEKIVLLGLCHWRQVELIDELDLKSVWRYAFKVTKVKATDYTGVRNR